MPTNDIGPAGDPTPAVADLRPGSGRKRKAGLPCPDYGGRFADVLRVTLRRDAIHRRHRCRDCGRVFGSRQYAEHLLPAASHLLPVALDLIRAIKSTPFPATGTPKYLHGDLEMFVTETSECIPATESHSRRLVREWCEAAGLDPADCFPLDRDDAAEVLASAGYAVNGDELRRLGAMGQVPNHAMLDAKDLLACAAGLESRRQWKFKSVHDAKKHPQMLLLESVLADGEDGIELLRAQFTRFDLRFALLLLVEADSRELREKLLSTIHALLAIQGVRI